MAQLLIKIINSRRGVIRILLLLWIFTGCFTGTAATPDGAFDSQVFLVRLAEKSPWEIIPPARSAIQPDTLPSMDFFDYVQEYHVENLLNWEMRNPEKGAAIYCQLYSAPDQAKAFGLYSVEKSPSLRFFRVGFEAFRSGDQFICWYGRFVLLVQWVAPFPGAEKKFKKITEQIIRLLPEQKHYLPILEALPDRDLVKHSQKFYPVHWLDQPYFRNIYYADYATREGYCRVFIIDNRTTSAADSNFWKYFTFIKSKAEILDESFRINTDYFAVNEPLWGKTILAKKNQIIYGILDYHRREWVEDRMAEILNVLKKKRVVKPG